MTEIYRVENKKGKGCYRNLSDGMMQALNSIIDAYDLSTYLRPLPENDKGIYRRPHNNEICGFESKEQAERWFDVEDFKLLRRLGYELKKVFVQKITATGEHQVLAIRG